MHITPTIVGLIVAILVLVNVVAVYRAHARHRHVLAALEMLSAATPRAVFVLAGFAVEVLGLGLVFRANVLQSGTEP